MLTSDGSGYKCSECGAHPVLADHVCGTAMKAPARRHVFYGESAVGPWDASAFRRALGAIFGGEENAVAWLPAEAVHRDEVGADVSKWTREPKTAKPDPRAAREQRRRKIDAVLAEDARRFPDFAEARANVVRAYAEGERGRIPELCAGPIHARAMMGWLREYEEKRGAGRLPSRDATFHAAVTFGTVAQDRYERARSRTHAIASPQAADRAAAIARAFPRPEQDIATAYGVRS